MDPKHRVTIEDIRKAMETLEVLEAQEPIEVKLARMEIITSPFVPEGWTYLRSADKLAFIDPEGNVAVHDVPQITFAPLEMEVLPNPHDDRMLRIVCRSVFRILR